MILKLFAVVDRVSGLYDGPHKAVNKGQFLRSFSDTCGDPNSPVSKHPEDFYAVELGTYNDATGEVIGLDEGPVRVVDATEFVRKLKDEEK